MVDVQWWLSGYDNRVHAFGAEEAGRDFGAARCEHSVPNTKITAALPGGAGGGGGVGGGGWSRPTRGAGWLSWSEAASGPRDPAYGRSPTGRCHTAKPCG